jgi:hypothetical protein
MGAKKKFVCNSYFFLLGGFAHSLRSRKKSIILLTCYINNYFRSRKNKKIKKIEAKNLLGVDKAAIMALSDDSDDLLRSPTARFVNLIFVNNGYHNRSYNNIL